MGRQTGSTLELLQANPGEVLDHVSAAITDELLHSKLPGSVLSDRCEGHWECSSTAEPRSFWNQEYQSLQLRTGCCWCFCSPEWSPAEFVSLWPEQWGPTGGRGSDTQLCYTSAFPGALKRSFSVPGWDVQQCICQLAAWRFALSSWGGSESFPCTPQRRPISLEVVQFCRVPRNH